MSVPTRTPTLRIVTVGHVDHGKSTLVGRILHETDSLPDGKYEGVAEYCQENHKPFEYAFLLDALEEERDQGITIDTAQVWFSTPEREFTVFDAPGHREFVKNMVCGAAHADVALIMIDALEGVREQSRRHGFLLGFLGIEQIVVVVNKMDLVDWKYERFNEIETEFTAFLKEVGVKAVTFIPISAREGDNVTKKSANMSWYRGPTVLASLHEMQACKPPEDRPLRFCIQDVFKFDDRRILAGRVESGKIAKGDEILFTPSNKRARVASIERWSVKDNPQSASAGESIGFTLDEQLFLERGELVSHVENAPVITDVFRARVFWMGTEPMVKNKTYRIKLLTQEANCEVDSFDRIIDASTLKDIAGDVEELPKNDTAEVTIRVERPIAVDAFQTVRESGRFVLVDGHDVCGGGTLAPIVYPDQRATLNPEVTSKNITWDESLVTASDRVERNGHAGAVVWMTGLSGAGKSTISKMLERKLYEAGVQVYRLDGDNVRHGLNADLGFSPDDRAENIRRIAEVANLMADSGLVVLTSFISPYRSDRRNARECVKTGKFFEIFVDCSVEACEKRDPKGLYRKARSGEIKEFTGISAPYEKPQAADIYVNTEDADPAETVESILARLADYGVMPGAASSA